MIENIKKYIPEDYRYKTIDDLEKEKEIYRIGYVGIFFKKIYNFFKGIK